MPQKPAEFELLDSLLEGCQLISPDYRYLYLNDAAARHARRSKAELIGRTMMEVYPEIEATPMFARLRTCLETGRPDRLVNEFRYDDGSSSWYDLRFERVPRGVFVLSINISPEQKVHRLNDHLPLPTLVWERRADKFVLTDVNEAAREITGEAADSLVGSTAEDLESAIPGLASDLRRCFEQRIRVRCEVACTLPGRSDMRNLVLTYGVVPDDLVVLHAEDVTDLRNSEAQLRASQRLDAVGQLAGGIAHDFNNLLTIILGSVQFVLDESLMDQGVSRADIEAIQDAGQRAADLTRQLLAFSRKQVLEPEILDLNQIVSRTESLLRRLVGEHIEFSVVLGDSLGHVVADPTQLEQVIMNLVVNARDAMPQGGQLLIETRAVEVDESHAASHLSMVAGPFVMLAVSDTGCGMDTATRERIFEPFFTTKEAGKGTGLGLSTVYGIVKQSGGFIWVYSEEGHGTSFKVYLPRLDAAQASPAKPVSTLADFSGTERILLVEDEAGVRRLAERILKRSGYDVVTAASGPEAIELCDPLKRGLDLLVTDVVMPRMSGQELAKKLLQQFPDLRVLFTSGYTDSAILRHGRLDHGPHFLSKPFSAETLTRRVREVLDLE